jgi:hypothetical protein
MERLDKLKERGEQERGWRSALLWAIERHGSCRPNGSAEDRKAIGELRRRFLSEGRPNFPLLVGPITGP